MPGAFHHESLYRGPEALARLASLRITLCGAGAIGSNLADNLVRQGAAKLRVIDDDRVEQHNISTQIYGESDVGVWKVEALRNHLFRACGIEIDAVRKRLTAQNAGSLLKDADLVIDALDNSQSRQIVQDHARATNVPCIHIGLYEDYCESIWDEQYRVPADRANQHDVCDYPLARNLVLLAVAIASETIVKWPATGERANLSATLKDFAVRPLVQRV